MTIMLKRAYEKPSSEDGTRVLVERLWPRGVKKENACIDQWPKDIAPSPDLRKWYSHDPAKWPEFKKRYWAELEKKKDQVAKLACDSKDHSVTFVFGSRDVRLNSAVILKEYIETKF